MYAPSSSDHNFSSIALMVVSANFTTCFVAPSCLFCNCSKREKLLKARIQQAWLYTIFPALIILSIQSSLWSCSSNPSLSISRLVRYSIALCILGIVKSRIFWIRFNESWADDFVDDAADAFFAKSLDKIHEVVEIISAVESISGAFPKTSHIFRSWYIDVGSEPWNLSFVCLLAIVGLKSISGDPLPKTILSSLMEST